jgi:hypothetical protein
MRKAMMADVVEGLMEGFASIGLCTVWLCGRG